MYKCKAIYAIAAILLFCIVLSGCDQTPQENPSEQTTQMTEQQSTAQATQAPTQNQTQEQTTTEEEMTTEVQNTIPADADHYKNDVKLFNKSIMFCANEFKGEFHSLTFKHHGL